MRKKIALITAAAICMIMLLTACSNQIDKSTIMKDIEPKLSGILSNDEKIDDIEILEYNTDNEKDTSISLKVKSSDEVAEYINYFIATYYYSSDKKWIFDTVTQVDKESSSATPKKGVNEEIITSSLNGEFVEINGEEWQIESKNIKKISIESQETNLDDRKDNVTVTLTLDDAVQEAEGKLIIDYIFDKKWQIKSVSEDGEFKITDKSECALEITDTDLINEVAKKQVVLFEGTSNSQSVSMTESEISDFEVYKEFSGARGTIRRFYCKGILTKPNAKIKFDDEVYYLYDGQWLLQPTTITGELDSIDIKGEWNGTYTGAGDRGKSSLNITEVTKDGKVTGVYSYTPDKIDQYRQAGSYNVSGSIDMSSLIMKLTAGDWVNKDPSALSITKNDISAVVDINESEIEGLGQSGYPFVLTKKK